MLPFSLTGSPLPSPPSHPCHPSSTTTTTLFFLYPFRSVSVSLGEGGTDVFLSGWSCLKHSGHLSPTANMLCWTLSLSATHLSPLPSQQRLNQVLKLYLLFSSELGTFFFLTAPCVNFLFSTLLLPALSVVTCSEQNVKTRCYNVCHTIAKTQTISAHLRTGTYFSLVGKTVKHFVYLLCCAAEKVFLLCHSSA